MPARSSTLTIALCGAASLACAAPLLCSFWGSLWVFWLFQAICHQDPGRSFWIAGAPMALCARCLGLATGAALGLLLRAPAARRAVAAAAFLLAADVATEALGVRPAWAAGRLLAGMFAGAATAPFLGGRR